MKPSAAFLFELTVTTEKCETTQVWTVFDLKKILLLTLHSHASE